MQRLVSVRGREEGKPILVLVDDVEMVERVATGWSRGARRLAECFWPGPLTLVLPARTDLPAPIAAGTKTVGVRVSSHPLAAALVRNFAGPVTAPSANPPAAEPPTTIRLAQSYFGASVSEYLDGGELRGGGSTVVAVEENRLRILRPGVLSEAELRVALENA